jgi:cytidylate kinase
LDPELDRRIDRDFAAKCNALTRAVIDYRLGAHFVNNAKHVFLRINENTAIERLRNAGRSGEGHVTLRERNNAFRQQFLQAYALDYTDEVHYDLVLDVDAMSSPEEVADEILTSLRLQPSARNGSPHGLNTSSNH